MGSAIKLDDIKRFEITEVYTHPDAKVDIVLVHGLNGDPRETWTAKNGVFWPSQLLPKNVQARVLVYGYYADVFTFGGIDGLPNSDPIHQHAQSLLQNLALERKSEGIENHPIIWIAHSLGGILVKRALELSSSLPGGGWHNLQSIYASTYGIMFLGTPHITAGPAEWGVILHRIASASMPKGVLGFQPQLLKTLQSNSQTLQDINLKFLTIYPNHLKVCVVLENIETDLEGTRSLIVDEAAAGPRLPGVDYFEIEATHLAMCKFGNRNASGYNRVCQTLKSWVLESPRIIQAYQDEENKLRHDRKDAEASTASSYRDTLTKYATGRFPRSSVSPDVVSRYPRSIRDLVRPRRGRRPVADSSFHRTVKHMEQPEYRDPDTYHRALGAVNPRVSYEIAKGYVPKSSSQVEGRISDQSNAEISLANINRNSGSLPFTEQGAILDMRPSPGGLKGKGRAGLATPSYISVVAASTSDTITRFEGATPPGTGPEQISRASTAAIDSPAAKEAQRWAAPKKKEEREADESIRPLDGQPKAMIREGKEALGAPEQPLSSVRVSLQRFLTEAVRHSSPPNARMPPYPTSPILGPSLVRRDFQARRRYSQGNAIIEPGPEPIPSPYYPGRPLLSNEAGGYISQPVSRNPSVESARSNRSAHSTGQLGRPSLTEIEPMPQLPATPRSPPTSYPIWERTKDWDSSARKQIEGNNLYSSHRRNSDSESKDSGFIESSDHWRSNPKTESAQLQTHGRRPSNPAVPSFSPFVPLSSKTSIQIQDFPEFDLHRDKITRAWREREREHEKRREVSQGLELKTAQGEQNMSRFPSSEGRSDSHGSITDDPYDRKSHIRILDLLRDVWYFSQHIPHRTPVGLDKAASDKLREALLDFFVLPREGLITVCKWEAPKVFRQWHGKLTFNNQMSHAEKLAAFQKTLLILGSDPCFEAMTLEDFLTRGYDSEGNDLLGLVTETLMSAIEKGQEDGLLERGSQPLKATYACGKGGSEGMDAFYQLLLFEEYIVLGCGSQSPLHKARSESALRIAQALRSPDVRFPFSRAISREAVSLPQVLLSTSLRCIVDEKYPLNFQACTILPLQRLTVSTSSCWTNLFKPVPVVVQDAWEYSRRAAAGLKLPFDMMLHLAAIQTATLIPGDDKEADVAEIEAPGASNENSESQFKGAPAVRSPTSPAGVVLHGFFTAIVPVEESDGVVRWHLEYNDPSKSDSEIQLIDPYNLKSTSGDWLRVDDYKTFQHKECILGWWDEANIMLGTKALKNNVRFSKPSSTKSRSLHLKEITAIGQIGASTVVPISIQAGGNFQFVNNVQHFGRENMYAIALMKMANDIALVYDAESHCGWLVPKLSLVLHMSHTYYNTVLHGDASTDPIPYAEPSFDGAAAALAALQGKGNTVLYPGGSDGDILLSSILATIHSNICDANKTREASKPGKLLASQYLNLIEEPAAGSDITITKTPSSIKAWLGIIDRVGCVMVCAGLGEAIKPVAVVGKCTKGCDKIPHGKGYLAAHFWCLKKLLWTRGWDLVALTDQAVSINDNQSWSLRGKTFNCCILDTEHSSRWDNRNIILQQVVKDSKWKIRSTVVEKNTAPKVTGAVVFGIPGDG